MKTKATKLADGKLYIEGARLSFPKLFKAEAIKGMADSKPRFGAAFLIPKTDTETIAFIQKELDALVAATPKLKGKKVKPADSCFRDGDEETLLGYEGMMYLAANRGLAQGRPTIVDRDKSQLAEEDGKPYGGCYVDTAVSLYVPKDWSKLCASLEIVRFRADGERFGAGPASADDLPDLADDEDGDDGLD